VWPRTGQVGDEQDIGLCGGLKEEGQAVLTWQRAEKVHHGGVGAPNEVRLEPCEAEALGMRILRVEMACEADGRVSSYCVEQVAPAS
jgi:hypothetical protein